MRTKEYNKEWYKRNRDNQLKKLKEYRLKNKELLKIRRKEHYNINRQKILDDKKKQRLNNLELARSNDKRYYKNNREKAIKRNKNYRNKIKLIVYNHYSNFNIKCNCCGENTIEFLSIDHVNNDGAINRTTIGKNLVYWLYKNNFPPGFQILCHNCNFAKGKDEDHICPHKKQLVLDYFKEV